MTEHAATVLNDKCEGFEPSAYDDEVVYVYVRHAGEHAGTRYYLSPNAHRMRQQLRDRYRTRISQGLPPHD